MVFKKFFHSCAMVGLTVLIYFLPNSVSYPMKLIVFVTFFIPSRLHGCPQAVFNASYHSGMEGHIAKINIYYNFFKKNFFFIILFYVLIFFHPLELLISQSCHIVGIYGK